MKNAEQLRNVYEELRRQKKFSYDGNCEKIRRLKLVKNDIQEYKSIAEENYRDISVYEKNDQNFSDWNGDIYLKLHESFDSEIVTAYKNYVKRVDEVLDEICNEITCLENKNFKLHGDIIGLVSLINTIVDEVGTWFN